MKLIESLSLSVQEVMDLDAHLVKTAKEPHLHLYAWNRPALTYGYFIDPESLFLKGHSLEIGRRPTGGGALFHQNDFTFSLIFPRSHPFYALSTKESYGAIHKLLKEALYPLVPVELFQEEICTPFADFCMAHPVEHDLQLNGKKVGGAAERRTREGLLHQASLALFPPDPALILSSLVEGEKVLDEMKRRSGFLRVEREAVRERLLVVFNSYLE